jgi:hypothetical protein
VLAENAAVTLDTNTISIGCADVAGEGSSGGLTGATSSGGTGGGTGVPEPSTFLLVGCGGILGLLVLRRNA